MSGFSVCRICLTENVNVDEMQLIFDSEELGLLQKIKNCSGVLLKEHEQLPKMMCSVCLEYLNTAEKFRMLCHSSESTLLNLIIKEEKSEIEVAPDSITIAAPANEFYELPTEFISAEEIEMTNIPEAIEQVVDDEFVSMDESPDYVPSGSGEEDDEDDETTEVEYLVQHEDDIKEEPLIAEIVESDVQKESPKRMKRIVPARKRGRPKGKTVVAEKAKPAEHTPKNGRKGRRKDTEESPPASIMCEICGNIYSKPSLLNMHMRRHMADKPFDCEICGKTFACPSEIRRHMRVHTGEKPYVCKFCGRTFADRSTNIKHERIHTNERPFRCKTCGKTFTYSNVLKNHMLTHTGEKPFSCLACNKTFSRKHQLDQHCSTLTHQQTLKTLRAEMVEFKVESTDDADTELIGATTVVESTIVQ